MTDLENDNSEASAVSPAKTEAIATSQPSVAISGLRRAFLLQIFCLALFTDAFMTSSMIICIDSISKDFQLAASIGPWVITAYNLTFGSLLLLAGRASDIYHPKPIFICGFSLIGIAGIGGGFTHSIITLAIVRAIQGIGAAMTIPSATSMLTILYTTPMGRGIALTIFAAFGTVGLCSGFLLGGVIVEFATWRWVMWITAIVTIPLSLAAIFLTPSGQGERIMTSKRMDTIGVLAITVSIILLVFSLSQAPVLGWGTARVLASLIISILLMIGFFIWQTQLPVDHALIPPRLWFIPNFLVLVLVSFGTQIYLTGPVFVFSVYWPIAYGWGPLSIGLHVLPIGVTSAIVCVILARYIIQLPPRIALICANSLCGLCSILLVFASSRDRYWSYMFPSLVLITIGSATAYMVSNIGIVTSVSTKEVGIAAAIFNAAQQVGGAITIAVVSTINAQIQHSSPYPSFKSPSAAMWFIVALGLFQAIIVLVFFKPRVNRSSQDETVQEIR